MKYNEETVILAVNGTLMRGLELEKNLLEVGATFISTSKTQKSYRLYSVNDHHPAMVRVGDDDINAVCVDVELWRVPLPGLAIVLMKEPPGLSIGKVPLNNGDIVLGVIAEPELIKGQKEISSHHGWRNYLAFLKSK